MFLIPHCGLGAKRLFQPYSDVFNSLVAGGKRSLSSVFQDFSWFREKGAEPGGGPALVCVRIKKVMNCAACRRCRPFIVLVECFCRRDSNLWKTVALKVCNSPREQHGGGFLAFMLPRSRLEPSESSDAFARVWVRDRVVTQTGPQGPDNRGHRAAACPCVPPRCSGNEWAAGSEIPKPVLASSLSFCYLCSVLFWRRKWQPTPVFLPGEFHGQRSVAGFRSWGRKGSDMTEAT